MPFLWLRDQASDVLDATRFLSRLPLPAPHGSPEPLAGTLRYAPLAGVLIAVGPAMVLLVAIGAGLPTLAGATLAVASLTLVTGALHEDGLADVADGFGGGATVRRKLEIMRDSRIGTYGAMALGTGLLLRIASLQGLADRWGAAAAALALVAAAVLSRALMLIPFALLPPARPDGLARLVLAGRGPMVGPAITLAFPLAAGLGFAGLPDKLQVMAALIVGTAAALALTRLARRHVGGVTGDVIGATQQSVEIAFLLTLCATPQPA